ncbi:Recombination inhibitory protein MutS2 [Brevinematales bacterium NS]|nr:Recombination inhibitory protein MutS2 [Brevinematales bacterium NS]
MEKRFDGEVLDFPRLLALLAGKAKIQTTREAILSLQPFDDKNSLLSDLETLTEYIQLAHRGFSFASDELPDMKDLFQTLSIEGALLSPAEVMVFRRFLALLEANRFLFQEVQHHQDEYPHLYSLCATVKDYPELRKTIDAILSSEGEIYENASQELVEIRQKKHSLRKSIQQRLEEFMEGPGVAEFLQDRFVTVKEGRFVLPIKTSLKNVFQREYQAILHSYSKTGETVYMEPAFIVDANNEVLEIDELETKEMWRLMGEITEALRVFHEELRVVWEVLPAWEWLHLRFLFWKEREGVIPSISDAPVVHLREVRHPFLGEKAVPVDILLEGYQALIISGPNAGGKTVSLKTTGLSVLMGLSGIPIPAEEATIGFFRQVYAEIGDEQSLERELSSFTGQIHSLQRIWEKADERTLVLIDEIANNTDPREGEAMAKAYIQALLAKKAVVVITTHYHGLKHMAYEDERIQNASALFDREHLKPLYKLHYGEFSMSFALDIARRHGLAPTIIEKAYAYLEESLSPTEKLLLEVEKQKQLLAVRQQELDHRLLEVNRLEQWYQRKIKEIEEREKHIKEKHIEKLSEELATLREEIARLKEKIKQQELSPKDLEVMAEAIDKRLKTEQKTIYKPIENPVVGQKVYVPSFQAGGVIESVHRDKAKVRIGGISLIVSLSELYEYEAKETFSPSQSSGSSVKKTLPVGGTKTIDVRGKTVDEALREIEKALDRALLDGMATLSIIHGIGEGILQRAIHDFLKGQKGVVKYEFAPPHEGGRGKTIVMLG